MATRLFAHLVATALADFNAACEDARIRSETPMTLDQVRKAEEKRVDGTSNDSYYYAEGYTLIVSIGINGPIYLLYDLAKATYVAMDDTTVLETLAWFH